MIVIVAPYSPIGRASFPNLGASRKIEIIITQLAELTSRVVLVNTAHNTDEVGGLVVRETTVAGVAISEIIPPIYKNRQLGKLINLVQVGKVVSRVMEIGSPSLVWLYNGYAFESIFAHKIKRLTSCPLVLEFEDWHFARRRGWNPKPYLDWIFWSRIKSAYTRVYAVNATVASKASMEGVDVRLLPGIVPQTLLDTCAKRQPFSDPSQITVGYFGRLVAEKGADKVISFAKELGDSFQFVVSGAGPLEGAMADFSKNNPKRLKYLGRISDDELYQQISRCDILLNPHKDINHLANGVFPFKVVEAIASGRVLVSSALPQEGFTELLNTVLFFDGSIEDGVQKIRKAQLWYQKKGEEIKSAADRVVETYGETCFVDSVRELI